MTIKGALKGAILFILVIIVTVIFDLLWAFPLMWAWNYVMTYLFGLPELNWSMSFCLLFILTSLWKIVPVSYER